MHRTLYCGSSSPPGQDFTLWHGTESLKTLPPEGLAATALLLLLRIVGKPECHFGFIIQSNQSRGFDSSGQVKPASLSDLNQTGGKAVYSAVIYVIAQASRLNYNASPARLELPRWMIRLERLASTRGQPAV
jgi:hypothetical protein